MDPAGYLGEVGEMIPEHIAYSVAVVLIACVIGLTVVYCERLSDRRIIEMKRMEMDQKLLGCSDD